MITIKLVVIGASGVGKTSLRSKYISGRFSNGYRATIGADFISKTLPHPTKEGESVTLQIWDTAGQERFSSLSSAFFRGADAALLMFDVNEPNTLEALDKWWAEFKDRAPISDNPQELAEFCCVVVGGKCDLVDKGKGSVSGSRVANGNGSAMGNGSAAPNVHEAPRPDPVTENEAHQFLKRLIPVPEDLVSHPYSHHLHRSSHHHPPDSAEARYDPDEIPGSDDNESDDEGGSPSGSENPMASSQVTLRPNHIEIESLPTSPISPFDEDEGETPMSGKTIQPAALPSSAILSKATNSPPETSTPTQPISVSFSNGNKKQALEPILLNGGNDRSVSRSRSRYSYTGTFASSMSGLSIYHTPTSSVYGDSDFQSARSSPAATNSAFYSQAGSEPPSPMRGREGFPDSESDAESEPSTPGERSKMNGMARSFSSGSGMTMTPSLFAKERTSTHSPSHSQSTTTTDSTPFTTYSDNQSSATSTSTATRRPGGLRALGPPPDTGPKLFFTSAVTNAPTGVNEIFEYIARRVVARQEWNEKIESRRMEIESWYVERDGNARGSERGGGVNLGAGGKKEEKKSGCC